MYRSLLPPSVVLIAILTSLPAPARADGMEPQPRVSRPVTAFSVRERPPRTWHRRAVGPRRWHARVVAQGAPVYAGAELAYGWLPGNLNLPIYNAPSDGPPPQL